MDDESAFLRAICADPDDDVVRLVFADWLQERGRDDRAEFIRIQIELTRLPDDGARPPALRGRAYQLMKEHRAEWLAELPDWARKRAVFDRGFVTRVEGYATDWLADGAGLFDRVPLRGVSLHRAADRLGEILADDNLPRLRELDLRFNRLGDAGVRLLAGSRNLSRIDTLHLWNNEIGDAGVRSLARSEYLAGLRVLSLGGNDVTDHGARELAGSSRLAGLEQIVLYDNRIGGAGRTALRDRFGDRVWLEMES